MRAATAACAIRLVVPCILVQLSAVRVQAGRLESPGEPADAAAVALRLHFSEQAAFLYFIDTLSGWSPYCADVDPAFLGIPDLGESDRMWLQRYAEARRPMGYDAETGLFLWAEAGFPPEGSSPGHLELRAALDHFWNEPKYRGPLAKRMAVLERRRPDLEGEVARLKEQVKELRGVVDVFRTTGEPGREVPVFVMYTLHPRSSQGGANGGGIFTSVDTPASPKDALGGMQILHEYLHILLRPRDCFHSFTASDPHLHPWHEALASVAPDERGDDEACMLDEILVYSLANVVIGGRDPDRRIQNYARGGDKQMVRTWDGVRVLLPIIRRQLATPLPRDEFLSLLIGTFVKRVQYRVWSCPEGVTIESKPS